MVKVNDMHAKEQGEIPAKIWHMYDMKYPWIFLNLRFLGSPSDIIDMLLIDLRI